MATRTPLLRSEPDRTPVSKPAAESTNLEGHAAVGLWAASLLLLIGTAVDLGTLWLLQRQDLPTWEFVAIGNTIDAYPRIVLGFGLLFPAVHFQRWGSVAVYRVLSTGLLLLGLAALGLGLLEFTDYLALRPQAGEQAFAVLRSTTLKAVTLSGAFFVILTALSIVGWRRPRAA